ncbi:hypothetical protein HDV63DRAFT_364737 [Trichoderma sp. SZMC 28014]
MLELVSAVAVAGLADSLYLALLDSDKGKKRVVLHDLNYQSEEGYPIPSQNRTLAVKLGNRPRKLDFGCGSLFL